MSELKDLYLHEQLLLLALSDEKGTMQSLNFEFGAGGAVLAELLLTGRLGLEQARKKQFVKLTDDTLTGDPLLDEVLQRVRAGKRPEQPAAWVRRIAGTKRLRHRIAERLRYRGILGKKQGRVLLVFSRDLYPTLDPEPERALLALLREALLGTGEVAPTTAILLALAHHIGLDYVLFSRPERKAHKRRLKQLVSLESVAGEAREAVKCVQEVIEANNAAAVIAAT